MVVQDLYPIDPKSDPSNPLFKLISEGVRKISVIFCRISIEMSDKSIVMQGEIEPLMLKKQGKFTPMASGLFCVAAPNGKACHSVSFSSVICVEFPNNLQFSAGI